MITEIANARNAKEAGLAAGSLAARDAAGREGIAEIASAAFSSGSSAECVGENG
jgi:hypothetical protein